ncbi:DUF3955 domain-containing protein [Pseudodesulfovibrio sp.]|uniref:DUF3955 domain-containing protein n=1 Tax=Pseudodesulfovibrio sp. TaxID=2035812 RepID=UPI0026393220|nr:DUF3955 domain-containing protein [Pseudodesulfovibrio sp.]
MHKKILVTGIIVTCIGILFGAIQRLFYGYIDADGFLHDSIFLPLSVFFIGVGMLIMLGAAIKAFLRK